VDVLLNTIEGTFRRQGLRLPYDRRLVKALDSACQARNAGRAFFAVDDDKRCHAAAYLVWDARSAYYLLGGADPDLRSSGAMSLLLWRAIQFAATVSSRFDFEGSMLEPVERFVRSFGAVQKPYFCIRGYSRRMRAAQSLRDLWDCAHGRGVVR
jgi:hypothetical protein